MTSFIVVFVELSTCQSLDGVSCYPGWGPKGVSTMGNNLGRRETGLPASQPSHCRSCPTQTPRWLVLPGSQCSTGNVGIRHAALTDGKGARLAEEEV